MREYDPISVGGGGEFAMLTEKESSWDDILRRGICVVMSGGRRLCMRGLFVRVDDEMIWLRDSK